MLTRTAVAAAAVFAIFALTFASLRAFSCAELDMPSLKPDASNPEEILPLHKEFSMPLCNNSSPDFTSPLVKDGLQPCNWLQAGRELEMRKNYFEALAYYREAVEMGDSDSMEAILQLRDYIKIKDVEKITFRLFLRTSKRPKTAAAPS